MIGVEIAPESIAEIEALRLRLRLANQWLVIGGDSGPTRMMAYVATELGAKWEAGAPRLTGTLAAATREQVLDDTGRVFVDPTVTNPVFGGNPAEYGPAVHQRRPWVAEVMASDAPGILSKAGELFFAELQEIFAE
ncbi:MAG: hypothetical protein IT327_07875 [Anaerolineae bacterium]|nr:hypothetical protein [Anaerolineae bacterium]